MSKRVGARHYAKLLRQADGHYGRYSAYLGEFRKPEQATSPREKEPEIMDGN